MATQQAPVRFQEIWGKVYGSLLASDRTELTDEHCDGLIEGRGMTPEEVMNGGYRSLDPKEQGELEAELTRIYGDELAAVPGFEKAGRKFRLLVRPTAPALLVPIRGLNGWVRAIQVRRFDGGPKYQTISGGPAGSPGSPLHVPAAAVRPILDRVGPVRVTEGPIKANVATSRTAVPTVGVPGVSVVGPVLSLLKTHRPPKVLIAFDQDRDTKRGVQAAINKLAERLLGEGHEVEVEHWDKAHKGIDDALLAGAKIASRAYQPRLLRGGVG